MLRIYTMDDWSLSSPENGVTDQGRRIGEYSALPADEPTPRRGYMAPRQYRLKKGHVENRLRNVRTMKLQIFIIYIVDFTSHCWNGGYYCEKSHFYINLTGPASYVHTKYSNEEYGIMA
jgi:hypothetical protein